MQYLWKKVTTILASVLLAALLALPLQVVVFTMFSSVPGVRSVVTPKPARAISQYTPTGGTLVTGAERAITAGATSGNIGSWRGTISQDATSPGYNWTVDSNASSGLNQQVYMDNVALNNANRIEVVMRALASVNTINRVYQICDWASTSSVDNAADAQCTGGGWRTMNIRKVAITATVAANYTWHLYDGYWTTSTTGNTSVSTPLSNFISADANKRLLLRTYSTSAVAGTHTLDFVQANVVIDPVYQPAGFTQITGGSVTTSYINAANATLTGQSASDNTYIAVPGTGSAVSDFYLSYKDVRTYTGMNTVVVVAEQSCSVATSTATPKIYNFNTTSWENLTSAFNCATGDTTRQFAKNNVTITDYVSSGEIRIGWVQGAASTTQIRLDYQYILVGSTNTDSAQCEISFGTGTAANCANTRNLDNSLGSPSTWQITTELESTTFGHAYYGQDNDADGTSGEAALSANLNIPVTVPSNATVTRMVYAMRWKPNATTISLTGQFKDMSGANTTVSGGWTAFGTSNATTSYVYEDVITNGYFTVSADDYIDTVNNRVNVRVRTGVSTNTTSALGDIDFVFASIRWVEETDDHSTARSSFVPTGGALLTGAERTRTSGATSGNVGGWQGLLAVDATSPGYNWTVDNNSSSGLNKHVLLDGVELNGANKLEITMRAAASVATINRLYQICDWVSTANVDNAADAQCTGGGWRTMNVRKQNITLTTLTNYVWHIYDGYWTDSTTSNTSVSTPLSNFVSGDVNKRILLRAYSTSAVTGTHTLDFVQINAIIDPVYFPAGYTQLAGGSVTTSYINATNATLVGPTASDNVYITTPGTASAISDFYLSYKNVKTYTGMNTIVVVSEQSCSNTGVNVTPKIYNFNTTSWEDLTTAIACNTTDTVRQFAKNNITISHYVSSGEVRIGWYFSGNSALQNRIDYQYIILGSTNTDSASCEISFGTGTASNCVNTRTLDSTLVTASTWQPSTELESTTFSHTFYARDNDGDAASGESAVAANLYVPVTIPANATPVGIAYAFRYRSNSTIMTLNHELRDSSGSNSTISGGWTSVGATNATTTYTYTDAITNGYYLQSPDDYFDAVSNTMRARVRTNASTATTTVTPDLDFMFLSMRWIIPPSTGTLDVDIVDSGGTSVTSPAVAMVNRTLSFACQTATGVLGTSSEKVRVTNVASTGGWTVSIAATGGDTAQWTTGALDYDYNDSGGLSAGCGDSGDADSTAGQLSIDPSGGTITPQNGCAVTGLTLGGVSAFSEGATSDITVLSASSGADINCYWDLIDVAASQTLPSEQSTGSYSLNLTLTVVAN